MRIIWGIIWIGIGFAVVKYSYSIVNLFGHVPWAERYLGGGGSYTLYKIVGIILMVLGMMYMFNLIGILTSPLTPYFQSAP